MPTMTTIFKAICVAAAIAMLTAGSSGAAAAETRCKDVKNPYPGTRYEGVPLSDIKTEGLPCEFARRVAKGAHRKGLEMCCEATLRYRWKRWSVTGDLRPPHDRYVARRGQRTVTWRF